MQWLALSTNEGIPALTAEAMWFHEPPLPSVEIKIFVWIFCTCPVYVLVAQSCLILFDPMDCSSPGSSVYGIFPGKNIEVVAIPFTRGRFLPDSGIKLGSPVLQADSLPSEPPSKPSHIIWLGPYKPSHTGLLLEKSVTFRKKTQECEKVAVSGLSWHKPPAQDWGWDEVGRKVSPAASRACLPGRPASLLQPFHAPWGWTCSRFGHISNPGVQAF